jgi:hypothetical protein
VGLFRRREPLHERLAREGGLRGGPPPHDTTPRWGEAGIHGISRPREWDAVVSVAADLDAERAAFVALPDGTLVIEDGPDDVQPLAEALEQELPRPYRAEAVAHRDGTWAVAGRRIQVVVLQDQDGEEVEVAIRDGSRTLLVDGNSQFGSVPALESLLEGDGVVRARRIDGSDWEVRVDRL